jgi:peptidoglycan/xylan/chitin deacetylase (PgdA/CDA1 family)
MVACKTLKAALDASAGNARFVRRWTARRLILCYHRVHETVAPPDRRLASTTVHIEDLIQQLRWLAKFCEFRRLDDLVDGDPPRRGRWAAAVTFDDGYRDVFDLALPELRRLQVPVALFIATKYCEDPAAWPWWDLAAAVRSQRTGRIELPSPYASTAVDFASPRERAWLTGELERLGWSGPCADGRLAIGAIAHSLRALLGLGENAYARPEVVAAASTHPYVAVAPHTHSHPVLARLTEAQQHEEIERSVQRLKAWGTAPFSWFAYPFGGRRSYTDQTSELLRDLGYAGAVTTQRGYIRGGAQGRYQLPRLDVDGRWTHRRFRARVLAAKVSI